MLPLNLRDRNRITPNSNPEKSASLLKVAFNFVIYCHNLYWEVRELGRKLAYANEGSVNTTSKHLLVHEHLGLADRFSEAMAVV